MNGLQWKIRISNGWWLGLLPWLRKPPLNTIRNMLPGHSPGLSALFEVVISTSTEAQWRRHEQSNLYLGEATGGHVWQPQTGSEWLILLMDVEGFQLLSTDLEGVWKIKPDFNYTDLQLITAGLSVQLWKILEVERVGQSPPRLAAELLQGCKTGIWLDRQVRRDTWNDIAIVGLFDHGPLTE